MTRRHVSIDKQTIFNGTETMRSCVHMTTSFKKKKKTSHLRWEKKHDYKNETQNENCIEHIFSLTLN